MSKPKKPRGHLFVTMQCISLIPLFLLGIVIMLFCYGRVKHAMENEIRTQLQNVADMVIMTFDRYAEGDYHLEAGEDASSGFTVYKGNTDLTYDYSIVDEIKELTGYEVTLFYQDTRILTTLRDKHGSRYIGTGANASVIRDVLETGNPAFYTSTLIDDEKYYAYYTPLFNSDGKITGMVYTGKPAEDAMRAIQAVIAPIIVISLLGVLIAGYIVSNYTTKLIRSLRQIRTFLLHASEGNLTAELPGFVLKRNDELSEMGAAALSMQRSIRTLVEQDTLTGLSNRRYANQQLKKIAAECDLTGSSFVLGISDIDFFKKVNDTYGHDCGDVVLKAVADTLKQHMFGRGFVTRWGGEEFLLLYKNTDLDTAARLTEELLNAIRSLQIPYDDYVIRLTMTFGLAQGGAGCNMTELLQRADARLYDGKQNGRNQVVIDTPAQAESPAE